MWFQNLFVRIFCLPPMFLHIIIYIYIHIRTVYIFTYIYACFWSLVFHVCNWSMKLWEQAHQQQMVSTEENGSQFCILLYLSSLREDPKYVTALFFWVYMYTYYHTFMSIAIFPYTVYRERERERPERERRKKYGVLQSDVRSCTVHEWLLLLYLHSRHWKLQLLHFQ